MEPAPEDARSSAFELEEYRQVLKERRFVMTRYMQAVGLYVTLSGFGLSALVSGRSYAHAWVLAGCFTVLNVMALSAAHEFREMAQHAMDREMHFVARYRVQHMRPLFWVHKLGVWLVSIDQVAIMAALVVRLLDRPTIP